MQRVPVVQIERELADRVDLFPFLRNRTACVVTEIKRIHERFDRIRNCNLRTSLVGLTFQRKEIERPVAGERPTEGTAILLGPELGDIAVLKRHATPELE